MNRDASAFKLPGVRLIADELQALMLALQVLQRTGAGVKNAGKNAGAWSPHSA